jgi:hypothetical protein
LFRAPHPALYGLDLELAATAGRSFLIFDN